ncbi:N-acetyltransferase [candidate division KSB1 bacterium]|nr:N-acetyltransferase [candidate division KSB1 bacterium]
MLRRANIKDVPAIVQLINYYAQKNQMLSVSQISIYNSLRNFIVIERDNKVAGVGALSIIWNDLAEIRSLAIVPELQGKGLGRRIVEALILEAQELELPKVFTLTYQPGFFEKLGFSLIDKKDLPHKVWKDCINCPKFPDCDEIALIRHLNETKNE